MIDMIDVPIHISLVLLGINWNFLIVKIRSVLSTISWSSIFHTGKRISFAQFVNKEGGSIREYSIDKHAETTEIQMIIRDSFGIYDTSLILVSHSLLCVKLDKAHAMRFPIIELAMNQWLYLQSLGHHRIWLQHMGEQSDT
jgi:hypothetical protein